MEVSYAREKRELKKNGVEKSSPDQTDPYQMFWKPAKTQVRRAVSARFGKANGP